MCQPIPLKSDTNACENPSYDMFESSGNGFFLADYWSESDQEDIDGSLTLKQEGPVTLCDTYHRTPSVSYGQHS